MTQMEITPPRSPDGFANHSGADAVVCEVIRRRPHTLKHAARRLGNERHTAADSWKQVKTEVVKFRSAQNGFSFLS